MKVIHHIIPPSLVPVQVFWAGQVAMRGEERDREKEGGEEENYLSLSGDIASREGRF